MRRLTTEEFIERARLVHKDKYGYDKVNYINGNTKVTIWCPEHGYFEQAAHNHLQGQGCPECNGGVRDTTESFIKKAILVHGNKYKYDRVNYVNSTTPVLIGCPIHGYVEQKPINHLLADGCPECSPTKRLTTEEFIEKAKQVHKDKYDYSKTNYVNMNTPVTIHCNIHNGDFIQNPHTHLCGHGCPICNGGVLYTQEQFIQKAQSVHGDLYGYDKVNYVNSSTPVLIKCQTHGYFSQQPSVHTSGCGCPVCNASRLEMEILKYCMENNIKYFMHYTWDWLIYSSNQEVDFYLPEYNSVIECQGQQHFEEVKFFNQHDSFELLVDRDNNKRNLCLSNGIKLYYFSDMFRNNKVNIEEFSYPYQVFEDINELFLNIINNNNSSD